MMEEIWLRAARGGADASVETTSSQSSVLLEEKTSVDKEDWKTALWEETAREETFADQVLREGEAEGGLMLSLALGRLEVPQLESYFMEWMARDLEDFRAVSYAGRVLQEIAERDPALGVTLLGALTPAEKGQLVPAVARGWVVRDASAAFSWIDTAWVEADGAYIDRALQNSLYLNAMDALASRQKDYAMAAATLEGLADPQLKEELTELVARQIVRDGPENALDRLAETESGIFDASIMDVVAEQWAARDGVGAADWVLANEAEVSSQGARSIAKQLTLNLNTEAVVEFHQGLESVQRRDAVASEVARVKARREPVDSAGWIRAIEQPVARERAVFDALFEIGYEDFGSSVGYIDLVYAVEDLERGPVVFSTLKDWLAVDVEAVAGYLGSGRANLTAALSEDLLRAIESGLEG